MGKLIGKSKVVEGRIGISRASGPDGPYINIRVEDATSGVQFVDARMGLEDFGSVVTGTPRSCTMEVRGAHLVGTHYEHKRVEIEVPQGIGSYRPAEEPLEDRLQALLAPHEVAGWKGARNDLVNSHRTVRTGEGVTVKSVHFGRFVDDEGYPVDRDPHARERALASALLLAHSVLMSAAPDKTAQDDPQWLADKNLVLELTLVLCGSKNEDE